jgi:hypothetical protein
MRTKKGFDNILTGVGIRLAELRLRKGYPSIRAFANRYDLPHIQYWRMENGKANVTLKSLSKVIEIHKISLQEFFCLENDELA